MTTPPRTPSTEAGRALLAAIRSAVLDPSLMKLLGPDGREQLVALVSLELMETDILAIEDEARAGLDAVDCESILLALGTLPTWFPEAAAKVDVLRAALEEPLR